VRLDINTVSKEAVIHEIERSGCKMLRNQLHGDETKEEIVKHLIECECPTLKKKFII
jgi:hypothetical protein